ncbi:MAG TPA: FAD binding domain-containing protein [Candidatus Limnocylindria bacterium]|nr:FAD binding domain-containing protein [Candidatus Limnocylindria bacterium]
MPNAVEPPVESPRRLEAAYALLADADGAPWRPLAGGTDLMVQIAGEIGEPPERILDIWALDELRGIRVDGDVLEIGALTTYSELRTSRVVAELLPALAEAAATIGAAQIQNRGTIGGNVVNASPAGDTLPILLALDTEMVLGSAQGERSVAAGDFWPAYRATARRDDELLLRLRVPIQADRQVRFRKVGTRRAQAISKVVMALSWRSGPGATWDAVRLALGSVAATTVRAPQTEAVLEGSPPSRETADAAADALSKELEPIDDVRSTAEYRRTVAGRVLHRLVRDAGGW